LRCFAIVALTLLPSSVLAQEKTLATLPVSSRYRMIGFCTGFATVTFGGGGATYDAIVVVEGAAHYIERGLSGHDAAIRAMDELFGPIIGITLVLMSVFLPAAFLPGLTGRMYAQFALVIAATALLSAVNAVTLKPTQSALWLRRPVPRRPDR
jgi:HAE1 family hydrophobic/amphiphilic exporter-1